jgi:anti-anti-sigma regulatory factor
MVPIRISPEHPMMESPTPRGEPPDMPAEVVARLGIAALRRALRMPPEREGPGLMLVAAADGGWCWTPPDGRAARAAMTASWAATTHDRGLVIAGELDVLTAASFVATVMATESDERARGLAAGPFVLDLVAMTFLDTAGMDGLARAHAYLLARGRRLVVLAPLARSPRRVLEVATARSWLSPVFRPTPAAPS